MSEHSGTGAKSADALEAIASVFRAHYEQRSFSGAGLVKRGDEVLFSGAYTTVGDLDLFMRALAANRLLSEQLTGDFFKPKVMYRQTARATYMMGYAFEFALEPGSGRIMYMQKDGDNPGVDGVLRYYPDTGTVVAILANQDCNVWDMASEIDEMLKGLWI